VLVAGAAMAAFGVIHSVQPSGALYLPWQLEGLAATIAAQFVGAYVALAVTFALLSVGRAKTEG
jgi:AGZA family xanthine/uracil permease-like MFS transporter